MTPDHAWALYVTTFAEVWAAALSDLRDAEERSVLRAACRRTARKLSVYPTDLDSVLRTPAGLHFVRDALRGLKKRET